MNRGLGEIIIFSSGLIVGAALSFIITKHKYEAKAEKEIEDVKNAFGRRLDEIEGEKNMLADTASKAISGEVKYAGGSELKDDVKAQTNIGISNIIGRGEEKGINYGEYFAKNSKETIEVDGVPGEDDELETEEVGHGGGYGDSSNGRIVVIDESEYGAMIGYDYKQLYFYTEDEVLTDEDELVIDYPEYLVGDLLVETNFINNQDRTIYIRNHDKSCDFEVMKVFGRYAD